MEIHTNHQLATILDIKQNQQPQNLVELQTILELEPIEAVEARRLMLLKIFGEFEIASGKEIDEQRIKEMLLILEEKRISYPQVCKAREWILFGDPCRFGTIRTADFFPDDSMLLQTQDELYKFKNKYLKS